MGRDSKPPTSRSDANKKGQKWETGRNYNVAFMQYASQ